MPHGGAATYPLSCPYPCLQLVLAGQLPAQYKTKSRQPIQSFACPTSHPPCLALLTVRGLRGTGVQMLEFGGAFARLDFGCPDSSIHNDDPFATYCVMPTLLAGFFRLSFVPTPAIPSSTTGSTPSTQRASSPFFWSNLVCSTHYAQAHIVCSLGFGCLVSFLIPKPRLIVFRSLFLQASFF
ncbi:hypothetical protein K443DRAFT_407551 [Laccaria amethystina LaAM-08-1]|uniref:Uncharacterized protein n=1 Tax=Laccaria amethystina LaAM-08-1 TaxID=1095629 RepID=A0A0C9WZ37_9AGAR|nr:hypothetical protein K443DRAFT_539117 [Laccaria amethystina LaAM-08-1]KIJ93241.1 hypothetical protein K443DRAFT_407551 [Laccaria amethystina LaAM-08-1]